jgi:phthiocerol/phenolphthiocerol synthesis type-I polyketide synthase C
MKDKYTPLPQEPEGESLVEMLSRQAQMRPDHPAVIFLPDGEVEVGRVTYAELDRRARLFAVQLSEKGLQGQTVLLMLPSSIYYVVAFFGCLYAGAVPVPGYPPTNSMHAERMAHIVSDCDAKGAIVATASMLEAIGTRLEQFFPQGLDCTLIPIEGGQHEDDREWIPPDLSAGSTAYLQYTSGSTSKPRGVVVTHGNLMRYCESWRQCAQVDERDVFVTWLPLFHDMGLILGVIQALYVGATIVMMPPVAFLQKPLCWLAAMSRYRGTVSYAPNFAYELCAASLDQALINTLDLSSWAVAGNAAEPVHADTLQKFARRFAPVGYRPEAMNPSYGLAEATLTVTSHPRLHPTRVIEVDPGQLALGRLVAPAGGRRSATLVSCGRTWLDTCVITVDPQTCMPCTDGEVGEIWVRGSLVANGYWKRPEKTSETFGAQLADGQGPYMRTGDLGAWLDGHLYITGRIKDVIIIRGQNHYPQDIEHTVYRAHDALEVGHGAAFSVEVGNEERVVVVQEVRRSRRNKFDGAEVVQAVRAAVAQVHGLQVHAVQLLRPASVRITSSGKIQRQACKKSFLDGSFETLHSWVEEPQDRSLEEDNPAAASLPSADLIAQWLTQRIAQMQRVTAADVKADAPFVSLGLDSLKHVALSGELAAWLGISVEPMLLYSHSTVASLARHIASMGRGAPPSLAEAPPPAEPLAVVGIACRFPKAGSLDEYWRVLDGGVDAITEIPAARWDGNAYFQPGSPSPGKAYTKWGGFIDGVDQFDAHFFGISPREAAGMDPQQRLLLQTAWHALEDAGIRPDSLAGSDTGVFVGAMTHDYELLEVSQNASLDAYFGTGTHASILANRISYLFDLRGPSWVAETACSSSLVALHGARNSLQARECNLAIVAGVNTLLSPELFVALSQAQMLSPDGRCMTFDARANGYVRSEGCAVLILKRLADAVRDDNRIHGVIRSTAINQDGRSNGITAPSGEAQQAVIRKALAVAGVAAQEVSYVEAHGTGTGLGDPIEMDALKHTYGVASAAHPALWVGSAKSNIGHTEPVSGLAGLIKVMLAMRHECLPGNVHYHQLNPRIDLAGGRCAVVAEPQPWPRGTHPRIAGVSSFGFGGANAHVLVQEPPQVPALPDTAERAELFVVSAKTAAALRQHARQFAGFLARDVTPNEPVALRAVAYTANAHRASLPHRVAVVGRSSSQLADALLQFAQGNEVAGLSSGVAPVSPSGKTAFLFTGQGAQYRGMGRGLHAAHAIFREAMEQCDAVLQPLLGTSLVEGLYGDEAAALDLDQTQYAQPALFAVEYALARVWQSAGLRADYLIGHSLGEYVAACIAGVFSLEDGLRLVAHRGRLMQTRTAPGAMVSVRAPEEMVEGLLAAFASTQHPGLSIAARNTADSFVLSGELLAVERQAAVWSEGGAVATRLHVTRAFHSPLMDDMLREFEQCAREVSYRPPAIPVVSNVTGRIADQELTDPMYWVRHVSLPVEFLAGMRCLDALGCELFVEAGPHPVLSAFGKQTLAERTWLPSLRRDTDDEVQLLTSLGQWHLQGQPVDWPQWERGRAGLGVPLPHAVSLPAYPFQTERYWFKPGTGVAAAQAGELLHPLLGRRVEWAGTAGRCFSNEITATSPWYVDQHRAFGVPVLPLAGVVEAVLAAARNSSPSPQPEWSVEQLQVHVAMAFESNQAMQLQTQVERLGDACRVTLIGRHAGEPASDWARYASATLRPSYTPQTSMPMGELHALTQGLQPQTVEGFYERCRRIGLDYGLGLQGLRELWQGEGLSVGYIEMSALAQAEAQRYFLHPAMLDACFHVAVPFMEQALAGRDMALLPIGFECLTVYRRMPRATWVRGIWRGESEPGRFLADLEILDTRGEHVATVTGMQLALGSRHAVTARPQAQADEPDYFRLQWLPLALPQGAGMPPLSPDRRWLVLCDDAHHAQAVCHQFAELGQGAFAVTQADRLTLGDASAALDWANTQDWARLHDMLAERAVHFSGLLFCAEAPPIHGGGTALVHLLYAQCKRFFQAARHFLSSTAAGANPPVVICSRGALVPDGMVEEGERLGDTGLAQAYLNGMSRALALEFPYAQCLQADLDPADAAVPVAKLVAALQQLRGSAQIALRADRAWEVLVVPLPRSELPSNGGAIRGDACYLVTGGLRGIGLATAQWLAGQGARFLALCGRSLSAESKHAVRALEAAGVKVSVLQADVADFGAMRDAFANLAATMPPLAGVIHSAGLTEDGALLQTPWESFQRVLDPKVCGGWNLHLLTAGMQLDFFVLFSSVASQVGNAGQASYIAACAFLDALAHYRRHHGLPATSINWGYWSETGVAVRRELAAHMSHIGVGGIGTAQGMRALQRLIEARPAQCGAYLVDWPRFKRVMCPGPAYALLAAVGPEPGEAGQQAGAAEPPGFSVESLRGLGSAQIRAQVLAYLLQRATRVLRLDDAQRAELAAGFEQLALNRLGFDSLMSIEMRNRIRADLLVDVPLKHFLAGSTAGEVADLIHQQLAVQSLAASETDPHDSNVEEAVL